MKKIILITSILLSVGHTNAQPQDTTINQNAVSYTNPVPNIVPNFILGALTPNASVTAYLDSKLTAYNAYTFDFDSLNHYIKGNMYALEFNIGSTFMSLQRRDIKSPTYTETETLTNGTTITKYTQDLNNDSLYEVHTLKGFANNSKMNIVRFCVEANNLTGYIWNSESNHVLYYTTLQDFIKSNSDSVFTTENYLLIFDLGAIIGNPNAKCGAIASALGDTWKTTGSFENCTPRYLEIAAEGDYKWCQIYGSRASAKILENLFLVEGIYTINFNIAFVVNNVNLWSNNLDI